MPYKYDITKSPCAPSIDDKGKFKTCYSKESLLKIAEELKKKHSLTFNTKIKQKTTMGFYSKTISRYMF